MGLVAEGDLALYFLIFGQRKPLREVRDSRDAFGQELEPILPASVQRRHVIGRQGQPALTVKRARVLIVVVSSDLHGRLDFEP